MSAWRNDSISISPGGVLFDMNYYNEFDPKAAVWIQQLIDDKQIPYGYVDSRSILEVQPSDLRGFTQCHFFAGVGGWSLALRLAAWPPSRPIWTASLPCQPFSTAGKQRGTDDERHLAPTFLELVRQCNPPIVIGEQVASKLARTDWLPGIRLEFEALDYSFGATDLCSPCAGEIGEGRIVRGDQESWERIIIGPPHIRQRLYWVADRRMEHAQGKRESAVAEGARQGVLLTDGPSCDGGLAYAHRIVKLRESRSGDEGTGTCGESLGRGLLKAGCDGTHSDLGLPHSSSTRLEGCGQLGEQPLSSGWQGETRHTSEDCEHVLLPCRDGKTRRTQSTLLWMAPRLSSDVVPGSDQSEPEKGEFVLQMIHPLVQGIPRGVVPSGDPSDPSYANDTAEARAMRLKGFGNAIQIDTAKLFIKSVMEVIGP